MTAYRSTFQRISRRELFSPRAVVAITLAILAILACVWLIIEMTLNLLVVAVTPDHLLASDRARTIVDNEVVASAAHAKPSTKSGSHQTPQLHGG